MIKSEIEYRESHHVFPVSIFGKNKFTVNLTPKEHYIAHLLLYKICSKRYGSFHSHTKKMANAIIMMMNNNSFVLREYPSRYYEQSRKIWRENWNNPMLDVKNRRYGKDNNMFQIGEKHPLYGKKHSKETKEKISNANKGKLIGDNNPSKRQEVREKISKNRKGKGKFTRETHPKTILSTKDIVDIKRLWETEKTKGLSGYKFCRKYNLKYGVSPSAIGNIIYRE